MIKKKFENHLIKGFSKSTSFSQKWFDCILCNRHCHFIVLLVCICEKKIYVSNNVAN